MLFAHAFINIDTPECSTASIVTYRMYVLRTGRAMGADDDEDGDSEFEYAHLESDLQLSTRCIQERFNDEDLSLNAIDHLI